MRALFAAALIALALPALAQSDADRRMDELMVKSGLAKQLSHIEPMMQMGLDKYMAERGASSAMTKDDVARLKGAMKTAFAPDGLRREVRRTLAKELDSLDRDATLEWLSTPLGRKITRIEEQSDDPALVKDFEKRDAEARRLYAVLPSFRVERVDRLVKALKAAETGANLLTNVSLGIAYGVAMSTPPRDLSVVEKLRAQAKTERPRLLEAMAQMAAADFAYMYRTLSEAELDQYISFAESPYGRAYHDASIMAVDRALSGGSVRLGAALGGIVKEGPKQKL